MDYQEAEGLGSLYRLDPDLTCTKLDEDIVVCNVLSGLGVRGLPAPRFAG